MKICALNYTMSDAPVVFVFDNEKTRERFLEHTKREKDGYTLVNDVSSENFDIIADNAKTINDEAIDNALQHCEIAIACHDVHQYFVEVDYFAFYDCADELDIDGEDDLNEHRDSTKGSRTF